MKSALIIVYLLPPLYLFYIVAMYIRTRVPYVGTSKGYVPIIFQNIPITRETVIYDLGCGKGDFLFAAERYHPKELIGYELSPFHVAFAKVKARLMRSNVRVHMRDFFTVDVSRADLIYLFLVKPVLDKAWVKIKREGKCGAIILSLTDQIDGESADAEIIVNPNERKMRKVFVYHVPVK